jgi:hypothetical protein
VPFGFIVYTLDGPDRFPPGSRSHWENAIRPLTAVAEDVAAEAVAAVAPVRAAAGPVAVRIAAAQPAAANAAMIRGLVAPR